LFWITRRRVLEFFRSFLSTPADSEMRLWIELTKIVILLTLSGSPFFPGNAPLNHGAAPSPLGGISKNVCSQRSEEKSAIQIFRSVASEATFLPS
jgi:hypothetical protein